MTEHSRIHSSLPATSAAKGMQVFHSMPHGMKPAYESASQGKSSQTTSTVPEAQASAPESSEHEAASAVLPYGGDLMAAMRAGDRDAIKVLMAARQAATAQQLTAPPADSDTESEHVSDDEDEEASDQQGQEEEQVRQLFTSVLSIAGEAPQIFATKASAPGGKKTCGICFDEWPADDESNSTECPGGHCFCNDCLNNHIKEELTSKGTLPYCPMSSECGHVLAPHQVQHVIMKKSETELERKMLADRYILLEQRAGLQAIGAFPCIQCDDWMVPSRPGRQERVQCPSCGETFCSLCRRRPYHFRVPCDATDAVEDCWAAWVREKRTEYLSELGVEHAKLLEQLKEEDKRELDALQQRADDFQAMERWKAQNCRVCPKCNRCIQKLGGCDSMVCGQDYHGGQIQNGCGHRFAWSKAKQYQPQDKSHHLKMMQDEFGKRKKQQHQQRQLWEIASSSFLRCAACKAVMQGPCFLCLNCNCLALCLGCHSKPGPHGKHSKQHGPQHIFRIVWEPKDLLKIDIQVLQRHAEFGPDPRSQARSSRGTKRGMMALCGRELLLRAISGESTAEIPLSERATCEGFLHKPKGKRMFMIGGCYHQRYFRLVDRSLHYFEKRPEREAQFAAPRGIIELAECADCMAEGNVVRLDFHVAVHLGHRKQGFLGRSTHTGDRLGLIAVDEEDAKRWVNAIMPVIKNWMPRPHVIEADSEECCAIRN
eukprot:gnl/MRDRNA2_/MRDRNA2_64332_c0_seq1.p1 gnl/MRDRNA2_/MRDRNA2_64332_c0~~gnl/MRDRNA2_/MRDRNA2_64332_c0_seq1.p1  ORF type:complete len:734 (+),score=125.38 gnl/MRDRNA2_/MRDRNA2_64332_c0_seq1:69-2204(+)